MERISTTEAARRLGVSRTQIRRLIAAGEVRAEREPRPQGTRLTVLWDVPCDAPPDRPSHRPAPTNGTSRDVPPGAVPVDPVNEVAWLRARLERAEEERAELRRLLHQAHQTIAVQAAQLGTTRALAPAGDVPGNVPRPENGHVPTDRPVARHRRPWWAVWRRG